MAKIKISKSGAKSKADSSSRQSATPIGDSEGAGSKKPPNPFSVRSTNIGVGKKNPFTKKSSRPVPAFGKKAGPLSTPMGRQKSGSLSPIRKEFPTTDTSWIESGMTVRVKWICESASLGGPTPVEFEGEVKYVDGVWLNMIERVHPHAHAHVMREWIFEAKEVEQ